MVSLLALAVPAFALDVDRDPQSSFNNSGDNVIAPFDPPGAADSGPCKLAADTGCTVLQPSSCAVH